MDMSSISEDSDLCFLNFTDFMTNFVLLKADGNCLKNDRGYYKDDWVGTHPQNTCLDYLVNDILNHDGTNRLYRRVYWPILLKLYESTNVEDLIKEIEKKRNRYKQDKEEYITKPNNLDIQKLDPQIFHPLCSDDKNPWILKQRNQELKDEIKQDIFRTHSDRPIFQNEHIRSILNEILFVWAKKNPSISYKQGMNEILAIFFLINYRERADPCVSLESVKAAYNNSNSVSGSNNNIDTCFRWFTTLFDKDEIEADTFVIFDHFLNMGAKYFFSSTADEKKKQTPKGTCKTVLIQKCTYIFHKILKNSDKVLYNHLISLSIEPQIFLLRWVRLFYCREFQIEDVIILWDYFFVDCYLATKKTQDMMKNDSSWSPFEFKGDNVEIAHKTSDIFPLVDYFSLSMILYIRSFLLESDETSCLKRLFKYPPVENIRTLIDLAFKIKYRNEKKEKIGKKDEVVIANKVNVNTGIGIDKRVGNPIANVNGSGTVSPSAYMSGVNIIEPATTPGVTNLLTHKINSNDNNVSITNNCKIPYTEDYYKSQEITRPLHNNANVINKGNAANNNLKFFDINEQVGIQEETDSFINTSAPKYTNYHLHNSSSINDNTKIPNTSNFTLNLNIINNKLNQIINNLNAVSVSLTNEQHRTELQQNIYQLNKIKKQLQLWEKRENT